ncbi:MAG: HAMP domain-containing histidine kinase [Solirubrobacteraceae bacterium]|nr:HAMP domain-containing histidine kinase [Solirubrobacteraceae bacterium]
MTLGRRVTLTLALVAAVVSTLGGTAAWVATRTVLKGNVDDALVAQVERFRQGDRPAELMQALDALVGPDGAADAQDVALDGDDADRRRLERLGRDGDPARFTAPPARFGGPADYAQAIVPRGRVTLRGDLELPIDDEDRRAVRDGGTSRPRTVHVGGAPIRIVTAGVPGGGIQFGRPVSVLRSTLTTLALVLGVLGIVTVIVAAALGRAAARRVLRPVTDLADAAAHVEATGALDRRLPVTSTDEVGALTARFNGMLHRLQGSRDALDRSLAEQRNLVADASHELRTPVTSLRTNAEVLLEDSDAIPADERERILVDLRDQAEELSRLVGDLTELARDESGPAGGTVPVEVRAAIDEAVARARRDHRDATFVVDPGPDVAVDARPDRLARALGNLLDNAALHAAARGSITVTHDADAGGHVTIRVVDHGPGIAPADRERIFDRFWRGDGSRERPGSGLGLAIVAQVARRHGGVAWAEETPGGGATLALRLPLRRASPSSPA